MSAAYSFAQQLFNYVIGGSSEPIKEPREVPLVVSLFFYAATIFFARILRNISTIFVPKKLQIYVNEAITAFEMCACSLENAMVRHHYGMEGFAIALFSLGFWYSLTVLESNGHPCANVVEYLNKKSTIRQAVLKSVVQVGGALLSYRYAQAFWGLEITDIHARRYRATICTSDLQVPFEYGFLIEFGATFVLSWLSLTTLTTFTTMEAAAKVMVGTVFTCLGVDYTGMYCNPVNASNQTFGCKGTSVPHHIVIYWIGPIIAAGLAVKVKQAMTPEKKQKTEEKTSEKTNGDAAVRKGVNNGVRQRKAVNNGDQGGRDSANGLKKPARKDL